MIHRVSAGNMINWERAKKIIGNLLQDEKFPSIHIATGCPYPEMTGAKWDSKAHCDIYSND